MTRLRMMMTGSRDETIAEETSNVRMYETKLLRQCLLSDYLFFSREDADLSQGSNAKLPFAVYKVTFTYARCPESLFRDKIR